MTVRADFTNDSECIALEDSLEAVSAIIVEHDGP